MRIKTALFCSLSTAPTFQSWLFKFDEGIYRSFVKKLRESRGCDENKKLMLEVLEQLEAVGGGPHLEEFLRQKHPHIVDEPRGVDSEDKHKVFGNYMPGILTYPRRKIISGSNKLDRDVRRFLANKPRSDYIILDDVAYIEYLLPGEENLDIPADKWKIRAYKNDNK